MKKNAKVTELEVCWLLEIVPVQKCLCNLFENPNSSLPAKVCIKWIDGRYIKTSLSQVISLVSVVLVIISTVAMCLNTMPEFKIKDSQGQRTLENPLFALIEAVCISWFTVEYLLRLAGAPAKGNFIKRPLNVVDVLAILPYYLGLGLDSARDAEVNDAVNMMNVTMAETEQEPDTKFDEMSRIVMVFRIARILRIFKLARSSEGLQV